MLSLKVISLFVIFFSLHCILRKVMLLYLKHLPQAKIYAIIQAVVYSIICLGALVCFIYEYQYIGTLGNTQMFYYFVIYGIAFYAFEIIFFELSFAQILHHIFYILIGLVIQAINYYYAIFSLLLLIEVTQLMDIFSYLYRQFEKINLSLYAGGMLMRGLVLSFPLFSLYLVLNDHRPDNYYLITLVCVIFFFNGFFTIKNLIRAPEVIHRIINAHKLRLNKP